MYMQKKNKQEKKKNRPNFKHNMLTLDVKHAVMAENLCIVQIIIHIF